MRKFLREHWDSLTGTTGFVASVSLHSINDVMVLLIGCSTLGLTLTRWYLLVKKASKISKDSEPPFEI